MHYALKTLWHERQRYLPGVLAVAFSALLIALQCGLLLGLFSITSLPIDRSRADVWVAAPQVLSVDLGRPIPSKVQSRVASEPHITRTETYLLGFMYWSKPKGGSELCLVIGSDLDDGALGPVKELTPELRDRLSEPGSVVVDRSELGRLGITGVGDVAEITGRRVRVVGLISGFKSLAGPYVLCSQTTARPLLRMGGAHTTYVLARCESADKAEDAAARIAAHGDLSAFTSEQFSLRSRWHWLSKTKAGIALGFAAALGLLVGAVVTSQTLYAAAASSLREYAVLRALGVPRWRMAASVMTQSAWVGLFGLAIALPAVWGLAKACRAASVPVLLPGWLLGATAAVTIVLSLLSGLVALRSLRLVEPAILLR
jgi:putative ABC transport system permease protein